MDESEKNEKEYFEEDSEKQIMAFLKWQFETVINTLFIKNNGYTIPESAKSLPKYDEAKKNCNSIINNVKGNKEKNDPRDIPLIFEATIKWVVKELSIQTQEITEITEEENNEPQKDITC